MQVDFAGTASNASPMADSARWVLELLTGPAATIVATIAIALLGITLLQGRIDLRRGASVVIGIFIVFGAPTIAAALLSITQAPAPSMPVASAAPSIPIPPALPTVTNNPVYDPYAGAAMQTER